MTTSYGCSGCETTAGPGGCPVHGQRVQVTPLGPTAIDPRELYGHWSTAQLALKAVTEERDKLLLQVRALEVDLAAAPKQSELDGEKKLREVAERQICERDAHIVRLKKEAEDKYLDHIEWAWGVIANAGPEGCMGNWSKLDPEWVKIAENWRDKYHKFLNQRQQTEKRVEPSPMEAEALLYPNNEVRCMCESHCKVARKQEGQRIIDGVCQEACNPYYHREPCDLVRKIAGREQD